MPARYKARRVNLDAGRYAFHLDVGEDGGFSGRVVYVTPDGALRTVMLIQGRADAAPGEALMAVADPHDAARCMGIDA